MLHVHRQMSLSAVNDEYRRLSKLRHPDKVRDEAKLAATEDFKYLQQCYCRLKDFIKTSAPLEEEEQSSTDYPSKATKAKDQAMWGSAENRSQPPGTPPDGIHWEKRYEIVYPESIVAFLKYHDARLIGDDEHGSILADLNYLWRAVEQVPGLGYCLRVVVWTFQAHVASTAVDTLAPARGPHSQRTKISANGCAQSSPKASRGHLWA